MVQRYDYAAITSKQFSDVFTQWWRYFYDMNLWEIRYQHWNYSEQTKYNLSPVIDCLLIV